MTVKETITALRCTESRSKRELLDKAADVLERMVWIPVTERLPEPGKRVLATDGHTVGEAYPTTAGTWWRHAGMPWRTVFDRVVTHWMELPEGTET